MLVYESFLHNITCTTIAAIHFSVISVKLQNVTHLSKGRFVIYSLPSHSFTLWYTFSTLHYGSPSIHPIGLSILNVRTYTGKRHDRGRHNAFRARCPSEIHFLLGGRRVSATAARSGNEPETGNKSATTASAAAATAAAATTYHRGGGGVRGFYLSIALH